MVVCVSRFIEERWSALNMTLCHIWWALNMTLCHVIQVVRVTIMLSWIMIVSCLVDILELIISSCVRCRTKYCVVTKACVTWVNWLISSFIVTDTSLDKSVSPGWPVSPQSGSDWLQMGQILMWDFLRSVSVHFGSPSQNVLKQILKSPRFVPFGPIWPCLDIRDNL